MRPPSARTRTASGLRHAAIAAAHPAPRSRSASQGIGASHVVSGPPPRPAPEHLTTASSRVQALEELPSTLGFSERLQATCLVLAQRPAREREQGAVPFVGELNIGSHGPLTREHIQPNPARVRTVERQRPVLGIRTRCTVAEQGLAEAGGGDRHRGRVDPQVAPRSALSAASASRPDPGAGAAEEICRARSLRAGEKVGSRPTAAVPCASRSASHTSGAASGRGLDAGRRGSDRARQRRRPGQLGTWHRRNIGAGEARPGRCSPRIGSCAQVFGLTCRGLIERLGCHVQRLLIECPRRRAVTFRCARSAGVSAQRCSRRWRA